jgi:hypothetical protein
VNPIAGLVACLIASLLAGCSSVSPSLKATPSFADTSPGVTDPAIVEWIRFRTAVGLRSDEAWVRAVSANPAAKAGSDAYEIPLLPEEVVYLQGRMDRLDDARSFGQSYGAAFPEGFGGYAIDTKLGDRLVLMYTKDVDLHRLRVSMLQASTRPDVRQAMWTLKELEQFKALVEADRAPDPRIKILGADIDILSNRLRVNYTGTSMALGDTLVTRFGSTGWLVLRWLGPFEPGNRPVGALVVSVVGTNGEPISDLPCRYTSLDPDIRGEGGATTSPSGECRFDDVPVGVYRVDVLDRDEVVDRLLTSVEVDIAEGDTKVVRLVVTMPCLSQARRTGAW